MKLGLDISEFAWPGGSERLRADLATVARTAEDAGFDRISVMDHLWQVDHIGARDDSMLEAYTTLGFLAGRTSRVRLLALVTGVVYREPGLLAKIVSTLDVLSAGRAMLGVGAAWFEEEARGLGLPFPPVAERFERLEETLQICRRMWSDDAAAFEGAHYRLERTLNVPQPLTEPHPPILIGGEGEKRTLRLVAKYGQSCNLQPGPELDRKLRVLREHCAREGTDYDAIEKTVLFNFDVGHRKRNVGAIIDALGGLADRGIGVAHGRVVGVAGLTPLETLGDEVIPAVAEL
ncbi:LLM class F420-dependent oxidoreductase [Actinomadura rubrisoli]|uniref:LLM class F420-dependent oxidoreductase n=1 Tax=Actinomadura rubrisoli TaxID=2530368 RepID=A0A4R5CD24_9ACTN|nr:LLM class F420-dependent oxidoreductase [Actinomadura rubrisoli]TDD96799.1 LLM class F420-dependent oxidoreductase [Actinomadura rubrisoli]